MSVLGLDLNDAALTGVAGGELLFSEPGFALAPDGELLFGTDAWAQARRYPRRVQNRYWRDLADEPLAGPAGAARTAADLVHDHLGSLWTRHGAGHGAVALAVPPYWTAQQLGLLLGIAEEVGLNVTGLVDASIAATRREYPGRALLAVEVSLHEAVVSVLTQEGGAGLGPRHGLPGLGIEALERAAVDAIANAFVSGARFDPRHHADSEQFLYDRLHGWLADLAREPRLAATVVHGGHEFSTSLQRDAIAERVVELCQPLIQQVRALLPADGPAAIQLAGRLGEYPGLAAALGALPGVELFLLDPAAAARGACRETVRAASAGGYRLLTRLPWDQPPAPAPSERDHREPVAAPTHLVFGARAFRLDARPLTIGMELNPGDFGIQLDGRISGVSRQHCSLRRESGRVLLTDHSRYGTRLNGHRIQGAAVLQVGDVISVGSPAREFVLVAETQADGS